MLAVAKSDNCLDCVKVLLKSKAYTAVKDCFNNNLLHIAALNGNNDILDYLAKNLSISLVERNEAGETAMNICQRLKNPKGINILSQYQDMQDNSKKTAD